MCQDSPLVEAVKLGFFQFYSLLIKDFDGEQTSGVAVLAGEHHPEPAPAQHAVDGEVGQGEVAAREIALRRVEYVPIELRRASEAKRVLLAEEVEEPSIKRIEARLAFPVQVCRRRQCEMMEV